FPNSTNLSDVSNENSSGSPWTPRHLVSFSAVMRLNCALTSSAEALSSSEKMFAGSAAPTRKCCANASLRLATAGSSVRLWTVSGGVESALDGAQALARRPATSAVRDAKLRRSEGRLFIMAVRDAYPIWRGLSLRAPLDGRTRASRQDPQRPRPERAFAYGAGRSRAGHVGTFRWKRFRFRAAPPRDEELFPPRP